MTEGSSAASLEAMGIRFNGGFSLRVEGEVVCALEGVWSNFCEVAAPFCTASEVHKAPVPGSLEGAPRTVVSEAGVTRES